MKFIQRNMPAIIFGVLSCLSQSALAAYQSGPSENYSYLGYGMGYGRMNGQDYTNTAGDLSKSRVSWKGVLGLKVNAALAVEGQYIDFGAADRRTDRIKASGWTGGIVMDLMKGSAMTPYGKVGALFWKTDNRFNNISRNEKGTDLTLGLGLRFPVTDHMVVRTEYERFNMDHTDVDNFSAILQYNFF
ncbi:MAG TPA: outer membrane beta-barrel protein [Fluviicoccus sp.]|nr:outer membrane beta-barrel protein [Fluviicoccus sp.]